jgi:protein subunit release factor A
MSDQVIAHMQERIKRVRRIIQLAHDPEMIAMLTQMIVEAEADIERLKSESRQALLQEVPPPKQR